MILLRKNFTNRRSDRHFFVLVMSVAFMLSLFAELASAQQPPDDREQLPVRGVVRASAQAKISTGLSAEILYVMDEEGQVFKKDDLLVEFDCRAQKAELASYSARKREMVIGLKSALFLKKRNAGSLYDVEVARAKMAKAVADTKGIKIQLSACLVYAPYDGRIATVNIHKHEMSNSRKSLISIVAVKRPQIELVVPSAWLTWLKKGVVFQFKVEETNRNYAGRITRLGATVVTVSQTVKVFAEFANPTKDILPGMSGTAKFLTRGN